MASELRVNTLKDAAGANSVALSTVASGSAKAWVNFNGDGTVAVRQSFNTSGITDEGTGHYSTSFTNAMSDADYVVAGTAMFSTSTNAHCITYGDNNGAVGDQPTASRYEVLTRYVYAASASSQDCTKVQLQTSGDLA